MKIQAIRQGIGRRLRQLAALSSILMLGVSAEAQQPASDAGQTGTTTASNAGDLTGGITFHNGQLINGGQAFQVVDPSQLGLLNSQVRNAGGDSVESLVDQRIAQVSNCQSCQTGGVYQGGGNYVPGVASGFSTACPTCEPYRYGYVDLLYMKRFDDKRYTLSQNYFVGEFDWELAPRITFGAVPDCVHGWEGSFTGPLEWDRSAGITGTGLSSLFIAGLPIASTQLSAFNDNAVYQQQDQASEYWSFEASRTIMGWQVAKILYGIRYIDFQDGYRFISQNGAGDVGVFQSNTENKLIGGQVGLDMFYPVCNHVVADFRGRAGVYANFVDLDYRLQNAGATVLFNGDDDEDIAGVFELGSGIRFNLGEMLSLRAGSELWYLTGIATATEQFNQVVRPNDGRTVRINDDVVTVGLTLSAEVKY
ncbi:MULTISPECIES: hypothetical protein [Crateriforma]|uniref:Outer membrane protein transport protein (OMPP1/FadL/TodX) n=1 Tax=Crateriforma conspicua TaxID=2527996 RepID=A0A5C6FR80_9PLAN|nr:MULTISPECIES: hypothetical protein [Crateriforma]TWU65672.1 hypothetical protein V7x_12210 [Crateriforma conspicua]